MIETAIDGKLFATAGTTILPLLLERAIEIISKASRGIRTISRTRARKLPGPSAEAIGNVLKHEYHALRQDHLASSWMNVPKSGSLSRPFKGRWIKPD